VNSSMMVSILKLSAACGMGLDEVIAPDMVLVLSGKKSVVWRCVSRLENTGLFCYARTVLESTIEQVLVTAIN